MDNDLAEQYAKYMQKRLAHIDGLRGVAILMVVLYHAQLFPVGYTGVSLFLVLSGFCLSYPALSRHRNGIPRWFVPSAFVANRILRILPPYYAALALFAGIVAIHGNVPLPSMVGTGNYTGDLVSHILLIHNLTGSYNAFDGAFWSLALEWQWYFVFPVCLALSSRWPLQTLLACLACAAVAHLTIHGGSGWFTLADKTLPARMFEFVAGIGVAWVVAEGDRLRRTYIFGGGLVACIGCCLIVRVATEPIDGFIFGALVLSTCLISPIRALFALRPLAWLGSVSYSVYLIHQPVVNGTLAWFTLLTGTQLALFASALGIAAGVAFYYLVEIHFVGSAFRNRWTPVLQRVLVPLDRLQSRFNWIDPHLAAIPAE